MDTEAASLHPPGPLAQTSPELAALQRAVANCKGQAPLATAIGKKQGHVWHWLNRSGRVPAELVIEVERASGVPRHELRPDIYPPPSQPQAVERQAGEPGDSEADDGAERQPAGGGQRDQQKPKAA